MNSGIPKKRGAQVTVDQTNKMKLSLEYAIGTVPYFIIKFSPYYFPQENKNEKK
jgi:hypothetical protein